MEEVKQHVSESSVAVWTKEDDDYLKTLVSIHGTHDWEVIASNINMSITIKWRTGQECKERWTIRLDPAIAKKQWTDYEDTQLLFAHQKLQNRWADIATRLRDRNGNAVKNRFYSIFRKVKTKLLDSDFSYESKCELLKVLYVVSLMEHCFSHPQTPAEQRKNKDKNFVYSLLHDITEDAVAKFKKEFNARLKTKVRLEDLWEELVRVPEPLRHEPAEQDFRGFEESRDNKCGGDRRYVLPEPHPVGLPERLTSEEKEFIKDQAFLAKEPWSAGSCHQPIMVSPPQMTAFSAGVYQPAVGPRYKLYDGFSDFVSPMQFRPVQQPMVMYVPQLEMQFQTRQIPRQIFRYQPPLS